MNRDNRNRSRSAARPRGERGLGELGGDRARPIAVGGVAGEETEGVL